MSHRRPELLKMRTHPTISTAPLSKAPLYARIWGVVKRASARVAARVARYQDAHAEAVLYQQLSKLSDAELERRGIARGDLHRHVWSSSGRGDR